MALYDFHISNNERLLFPLIAQINAELILNIKTTDHTNFSD